MLHFAFDILRAAEAAAIASSHFVGCGDKNKADDAATTAMRRVLNEIPGFGAKIVIGEGKKDDAPGLFEGEIVGPSEVAWDIAVDPLDGTTQTAKGGPGAMSVIAVGCPNSFFATDAFYMKKVAYGPRLVNLLRREWCSLEGSLVNRNLDELLYLIVRSCEDREFTVCILDRPRHEEAIRTFRKNGWRVRLIQDCDVAAAIGTALPKSGIDLYYGIGGAPEGVLTAAALKCLGGHIEGMIVDDKTHEPIDGKVLRTNDLASGDVLFVATGVTEGHLLNGVRSGHKTNSIMTYSGTQRIHWIDGSNLSR